MRQFMFLLSIVMFIVVPSAVAQDAAKVDSNHYKVEFENSRVRVLRAKIGPHEKTVMHSHPDAVIVVVAGGTTKFTLPGGKTEDSELATGDTRWTPATTHQGENMTDHAIEVVVIELKRAVKGRVTKKPAPTPTPNKQ